MDTPNTQRFTFALVTETKLIAPRDLQLLAVPSEINAQHCAALWKTPPPAVVIASPKQVPKHLRPVVFVSDDSDDAGALAVHYVDPITRGPAARVYVDRTSGFRDGPYSTTESTTHEILEMLCNPYLDNWYKYPVERSSPVQVAGEVGDPTQDTYEIVHAGTRWPVANFVTPAWFASNVPAGSGRFDYAKRLHAAGDIGPEGYAIFRSRRDGGGWNVWDEVGWSRKARGGPPFASVRARARAARAHPWSRTGRLLAGVQPHSAGPAGQVEDQGDQGQNQRS